MRAFRWTLLLSVLMTSSLFAKQALAWSRTCKWTTGTGITTLPLYVNCNSFAPFGYNCDDVLRMVNDALQPWNHRGGTNIRFAAPVTTTSWNPISGAALIRMAPQHNTNPNIAGEADTNCATAGVAMNVYAHWSWHEVFPPQSPNGGADMAGVMAHELGHMLGFNHANDAAGACGGSAFSGIALMRASNTNMTQFRTLYRDDWDGLRSGSCPYTGTLTTGNVRVRYSSNGGSTWTTLVNWSASNSTNLTPGIAWGAPSGGAGFQVQAAADVSNDVQVWKYDGGWTNWSGFGKAMAGPAVAYGSGRFLVAAPLLDSNGGQIRVATSTNGTSWSSTTTALYTTNRVGLAYNTTRGLYYMAYSYAPNPNAGTPDWENVGRLMLATSTDGTSWSVAGTLPGEWLAAGPGILCMTGTPNYCVVDYPDGRVTTHTLRHYVFQTNSDSIGSWSASIVKFLFPTWKDRWIASGRDVSAVYDPDRTDFVYGFREGNSSLSGVAVWLEDDINASAPPTGFEWGDPNLYGDVGGNPGFNSGGEFNANTYTGVGVGYDDYNNRLLTIAHSQ